MFDEDNQRCIWCMSEKGHVTSCPVCGRSSESYRVPSHHLPPATILAGRYYVGVPLGEGGVGITYLGFDRTLSRTVAIKELYPAAIVTRDNGKCLEVIEKVGVPKGTLGLRVERFLVEARSLAKREAGSPSIAVFDWFDENGTAYIVMEYVKGQSLRSMLDQRGAMPFQELLPMLEPIFQTLIEMHEVGLLHRDVSPENIVVGRRGAHLVDYGLACGYDEGIPIDVGYKRAYASPEQYVGGGYGAWTDVYTLCATIYECLSGKAPPTSLDRLAGERLVPLSELGVGVSSHIEEALLRGMALPVSERLQSVEALLQTMHILQQRDASETSQHKVSW